MLILSFISRTPRTDERNGVDYTFLSKEEFLALEKSGDLLESGVYEGKSQNITHQSSDPIKHKSSASEEPRELSIVRVSLLIGFLLQVFLPEMLCSTHNSWIINFLPLLYSQMLIPAPARGQNI